MLWEDLPQVKMGNIGEGIVKQYLREKGRVPYKPDEGTGAHPFDFLCATQDKKHIFIVEVKTKPSRMYYPDTGFNVKSWQTYRDVSEKHNLDVHCFFVDTSRKEVYGNKLSVLQENRTIVHNGKSVQYPFVQKGIVYFPLEAMVTVCKLTESQCEQIEQYSTRNYDY
jgi:hypothetical protein